MLVPTDANRGGLLDESAVTDCQRPARHVPRRVARADEQRRCVETGGREYERARQSAVQRIQGARVDLWVVREGAPAFVIAAGAGTSVLRRRTVLAMHLFRGGRFVARMPGMSRMIGVLACVRMLHYGRRRFRCVGHGARQDGGLQPRQRKQRERRLDQRPLPRAEPGYAGSHGRSSLPGGKVSRGTRICNENGPHLRIYSGVHGDSGTIRRCPGSAPPFSLYL